MTTASDGTSQAADFDVIVVGSGAGGMTAALTATQRGLRTLVVEKAARFGGSSARSGGGLWLPNNHVVARAGVPDDAERARTYLAHVVGDAVSPERREAFLAGGPKMLAELLPQTPLRMH